MTDKFTTLPGVALFRIAYNVLSRYIVDQVVTSGYDNLRPAHGNLLEHLSYDDGLRLTDLAARAGMIPQSMGEMVDDLEKRGLVERRPDPTDRRARRVYLTDRGRRSSAVSYRAVLDTEKQLRALLGNDDYTCMREILIRVVDAEIERR